MKTLVISLLVMLSIMLQSACVHRDFEYPIAEKVPVEVGVVLEYYDIDMPLHAVVDNFNEASRGSEAMPYSRHIVRIYDDEGRVVASQAVVDEASGATVTRRFTFDLIPGEYTAVCWTDYADSSDSDRHYDTSAFPDMALLCEVAGDGSLRHSANTPWRDAFCGRRQFVVEGEGALAPGDEGRRADIAVEMRRPLARFVIEAADYEDFSSRHEISRQPDNENSGPLPGYRVIVRYVDYMPSVFSVLTDGLVDTRVGASFIGEPQHGGTDDDVIVIGSDYVFVNPRETGVKIYIEVEDITTGERVSRAGPVNVPLLRNHLTVVRGTFLTAGAAPGIVIDTGFDGEYHIKI